MKNLKTDLSSEKEKENLGEKLYDRIQELLQPAYISFTNTVMGMLMKQSPDDVTLLLNDDDLLKKKVAVTVQSMSGGRNSQFLIESNQQPPGSCSHEEINELLFEKVSSIEPSLAPFITGMILELDHSIVAEMMEEENHLLQAVKKAKKSFVEAHQEDSLKLLSTLPPSSLVSSPNSNSHLSKPTSSINVSDKEENTPKCSNSFDNDDKKKEEEFGHIIFERAESFHKEFASEIAGMILEMDYHSLKQVVTDNGQLDGAISKAYSTLSPWTQCSAF